jgi:glycerol-3-phosphate O-acyltransferase
MRIDEMSKSRLCDAVHKGPTLLVAAKFSHAELRRLLPLFRDLLGAAEAKQLRIVSDSPRLPAELAARTGGTALPIVFSHDGLTHQLIDELTGPLRGPLRGEGVRLGVGQGVAIEGDVQELAAELRSQLGREQRLHGDSGALSPKALAASIAAEIGEDEAQRKAVRSMILEMAANLDLRVVKAVGAFLDKVFNSMFDGIDVVEAEMESLRELTRAGPLVYCPTHRSHVDYLVLSYLVAQYGMVPPLVAAGENMNFFPVGNVFRHGGAFYIRRSFRGDPLYRKAFAAYMRHLLLAGVSLEFFPEGTRSRTGKCLPPRFGMFNGILDAYAVAPEALHQVHFVPVDIKYEKVPEIDAHAAERSGAKKRKETGLALLRLPSVLAGGFGRVSVHFGEPIVLGDFLRDNDLDPADSEQRRRAATRLGYKVLGNIQEAGPVTAVGVVAGVLLAAEERALRANRLLNRCEGLIAALAPEQPRELELRDRPRPACEDALAFLARQDLVKQTPGSRWTVPPDARAKLVYMRNQSLHPFVSAALLLQAISKHTDDSGSADEAAVLEHVGVLSSLLRHEFVFPLDGLATNATRASDQLERAGLTRCEQGTYRHTTDPALNNLAGTWARLISDVLATYRHVIDVLHGGSAAGPSAKVPSAVLQALKQRVGRGEMVYPEAADKVTIGLALRRLEELSLLDRSGDVVVLDRPGLAALAERLG